MCIENTAAKVDLKATKSLQYLPGSYILTGFSELSSQKRDVLSLYAENSEKHVKIVSWTFAECHFKYSLVVMASKIDLDFEQMKIF